MSLPLTPLLVVVRWRFQDRYRPNAGLRKHETVWLLSSKPSVGVHYRQKELGDDWQRVLLTHGVEYCRWDTGGRVAGGSDERYWIESLYSPERHHNGQPVGSSWQSNVYQPIVEKSVKRGSRVHAWTYLNSACRAVVHKWGKHLVKFQSGLTEKRPELL